MDREKRESTIDMDIDDITTGVLNLDISDNSEFEIMNFNEEEEKPYPDAMGLDIDDNSEFEIVNFNEEEETPCQDNLGFVDVQGFKTYRERFICKEFCLVTMNDDDDDNCYHAIIKSPYAFEKVPSFYKRQAKWLTKHFHGLSYDCGNVHVISVIQDVYAKLMNKVVIVKGVEKVKWVKHMFRNCGEIECLNFDDLYLDNNIEKIQTKNICDYHLDRNLVSFIGRCKGKRDCIEFQCAISIAYKMKEAVKKSNFTYNTY